MPRSFNWSALRARLPKEWPDWGQPRVVVRAVLGALLVANLVAAAILFRPWAGSVDDMEAQASALRKQVQDRTKTLAHLRALAGKVEAARAQGDQFMGEYFLDRHTASSTILTELNSAAQKSGIRQKETSFAFDPIEGSDDLWLMTVNAGFEGTFADLMNFVNQIDHSQRLLILESLSAAPQQNNLTLGVTVKLNTLVREAVQ